MKSPITTVNWKELFIIFEEFAVGKPLPSVSQIAEKTKDPYAILVSTLLSLRTRDPVTLSSSWRILKKAPSVYDLVKLSQQTIAQTIYPVAFYKVKAQRLLQIAKIIIEEYQGNIPDESLKLLALPGVGIKTANLVLSLGFNQSVVCVDTHVHRICNRNGWVTTKKPEETTSLLEAKLPIEGRIRINELLVMWGQKICTPLSPHCSLCKISYQCQKREVTKKR